MTFKFNTLRAMISNFSNILTVYRAYKHIINFNEKIFKSM